MSTPPNEVSHVSDASDGGRAPLREALLLGALSALAPLSADTYLPALPAIGRELAAGAAQAQLTLSAGILGMALGQLVAGPVSDSAGRRRPLLAAMALFALASLACLAAPSLPALLAARLAQGAASGAAGAIALAVAADRYGGAARARLFALLAQIGGLAPILAPVLGGQLLRATSWRGIFGGLALLGAALLAALAAGLAESLPRERRQRGGLGALAAFRGLLGDAQFRAAAAVSGAAIAAGVTYISLAPFVLQGAFGLTPQQVGLVFGANATGIVVMARVSQRLVGRLGPLALLRWGAAGLAAGGAALLAAALAGAGLAGVAPALLLVVASLGLIMPNATALAMAGARAAGSAAALLGVLQLALGALAAPLVGSFGAATPLPMACGIFGLGLAALAAALAGPRASARTAAGSPTA